MVATAASSASPSIAPTVVHSIGKSDAGFTYSDADPYMTIYNDGASAEQIIKGLKLDGFAHPERLLATLESFGNKLPANGQFTFPRRLIAEETPQTIDVEALPRAPANPKEAPTSPLSALRPRVIKENDYAGHAKSLGLKPGEEGAFQDLLHGNAIHPMPMPKTYAHGSADQKVGRETIWAFADLLKFLGVRPGDALDKVGKGTSALTILQAALRDYQRKA